MFFPGTGLFKIRKGKCKDSVVFLVSTVCYLLYTIEMKLDEAVRYMAENQE